MKIFEVEYKFFQAIRKARVFLKKELTGSVSLRYLSVVIIAINIFFNNLSANPAPDRSTAVPSQTPGTVLSQTVDEAKVSQPVRVAEVTSAPNFLGKAALVVEATGSAVLFEKNSTEKLPPASLTKLMTTLLVLENVPLDQVVSVSDPCTRVEGLKVGFKSGQNFTVASLLSALLLPSASDAACALVAAVEKDQASPSARFVQKMNGRAAALGLYSTNFVNASGLDGPNGDHYSTAADLMILVRQNLRQGRFSEIVSRSRRRISDVTGTFVFDLKNTNELLVQDSGFKGVKTGYTAKALGCLAFLYERDSRQILGVILGSPDRFGDAQNLVKWVFENFRWE